LIAGPFWIKGVEPGKLAIVAADGARQGAAPPLNAVSSGLSAAVRETPRGTGPAEIGMMARIREASDERSQRCSAM